MKHPRQFAAPPWCKPYPTMSTERAGAMLLELANWPKFHAVLVELDDVPTLRAYLVLELNTRNRPDFVSRIYKRLRAVREVQELDALWVVFPKAGCRNGRFVV